MRKTFIFRNLIAKIKDVPEVKLQWYNQLSEESIPFKIYYFPLNFVNKEKYANTAKNWSKIGTLMSMVWASISLVILNSLLQLEIKKKEKMKKSFNDIVQQELKELDEECKLLEWAFGDGMNKKFEKNNNKLR